VSGCQGWPDGPTPLMSRPCAGCWFAPGNPARLARGELDTMVKEALARELYVTCRLVPRAVCAAFYSAHTTAALRMIAMLWEFITVDPPTRKEAGHGHRAGRS
jgi:hypothetical protein